MNRSRGVIIGVLGCIVTGLALVGGATPSSATTCSWVVVPTADQSSESSLTAVASTGPTTAWAAGVWSDALVDGPVYPLIEYFDGTSWNIASAPSNAWWYLADIGFDAFNDGWVVGTRLQPFGRRVPDRTLAEHFDGASWTKVSTPNVGTRGSSLSSVWVRAANDVWAAGSVSTKTGFRPLILHFDGSKWTVAYSPKSKKHSRFLYSIHARSATEAWAVGGDLNTTKRSATPKPFALTFDGTKWSRVAIPSPGFNSTLSGVFQLADNDVVAVGFSIPPDGHVRSFNENYNHSAWKFVDTVRVPGNDELNSVYYTTAAGFYVDSSGISHPLIERQTGGGGYLAQGWEQQAVPQAPDGSGTLNDIFGLGAQSWAVGSQVDPNANPPDPNALRKTFAVHYECSESSPTPTSSPSTTPSPTTTPSGSPSATP